MKQNQIQQIKKKNFLRLLINLKKHFQIWKNFLKLSLNSTKLEREEKKSKRS